MWRSKSKEDCWERRTWNKIKQLGKEKERKGKAVKHKLPTPSTSEDKESDWSSASSEFYEGSTSHCSECNVHFRVLEKCLAIGCDINYCHRWYHRACIDINLSGMTEKEIQKVPFCMQILLSKYQSVIIILFLLLLFYFYYNFVMLE